MPWRHKVNCMKRTSPSSDLNSKVGTPPNKDTSMTALLNGYCSFIL
jgi:hypothetical protein